MARPAAGAGPHQLLGLVVVYTAHTRVHLRPCPQHCPVSCAPVCSPVRVYVCFSWTTSRERHTELSREGCGVVGTTDAGEWLGSCCQQPETNNKNKTWGIFFWLREPAGSQNLRTEPSSRKRGVYQQVQIKVNSSSDLTLCPDHRNHYRAGPNKGCVLLRLLLPSSSEQSLDSWSWQDSRSKRRDSRCEMEQA